MAEILRLTATLEQRGPAGAFLLTDEQVAVLGAGRKTCPVRVTVNGATLALRLARMGGENMIGLARPVRDQAGLDIGASYDVEIASDDVERTVEVPDDLAAALVSDPSAHAAFTALAYSHRKEFVRWISSAKKEATRADRVAKTVEMVRTGRTR
ncbi:MAG TPA: YdeI/OmpD-associated family protein [Kineosporiaceae bacterium]